ncbi:flagellar protein FliO [Yersinia massiliensis]|uniref:Flagellar protein n=1 Tax=Yersinia intermedia TaxID=631 RepID=A0A0H5M0D9_YERIN|nr:MULTISPECIES: flagellar biosynthetic protein FliO [Yersinia]MCB5309573.1 flagellar biosynthetic protein FliO [Yersinia massiliensis]CNI16226.1 flagellar protein FliO [Yersinia massiliensis]CRY56939.1 flagellar protein FliO [Yersinia intermedia]
MNTPLQLTTETTAPASAAFSSASLLTQVGGGLVIVLMIFVVAALLFKRFQLFSGRLQGDTIISIKRNLPLGPRGRLVVVEFNQQWLLLGVSAENISCLSSIDKPEDDTSTPVTFQKMLTDVATKKLRGDG